MNIHKVAAILFVLMAGTLAYAVNTLSISTTFNVVTPAGLSATPSSLSFGDIVQGGSKTQTFILTNTGGSTATIIGCTSSDFATTVTVTITGCPTSLGPGATSTPISVTITVPLSFTPGSQTGKVTVSFD